MNRFSLTTFFLLVFSLMTYGQNTIVVFQQDGEVAKFDFSEKPVVTYAGDNLVLTTTQTTVQYPIYMLKKISFDVDLETTDAIEQVKADVQFSFSGGTLTIRDGEPYSYVYIYNLKGMKVGQYQLDDLGNATIPVSGLSRDFYIVKSNRFNFKFRKS